jgi:hypothetical protein
LEIEVAVSIGVSAARRPAGSRRQLRVSYAPNPHIGRGQASRGTSDVANAGASLREPRHPLSCEATLTWAADETAHMVEAHSLSLRGLIAESRS